MQTITNAIQLKEAIVNLEIKQAQKEMELRAQFLETYESLKPINLIKKSFREMGSGTKSGIVDNAIGIGTGFIAKKVLTGASHNPFVKLIGVLLEVGVANFVAKHPDGIKSVGGKIIKNIFKKKESASEKE